METFAQAIQPWQAFYAAVSGATATLVGLLFVSLSLNLDLVAGKEHADTRTLAIQTFSNFIYVLAISLVFLIPNPSPSGLGITFLIFGALGTIDVVRSIVSGAHGGGYRWRTRAQRLRFIGGRYLLLLASYLTLALVAIDLWTGDTSNLGWVLFVIFSLLISGTVTAWNLLIGLKDAT